MHKYTPITSSRPELRARLPRFKNLNCFYAGTPSPTNSGNSIFTQASFTITPSKGPIKVPRLNTRTILSSKNRSVERSADDLECLDDYK